MGAVGGFRFAIRSHPRSQTDDSARTGNRKRRLAHGAHARLAAAAAAALLARLLVIGNALDVLRETFLLTHLLEPPQHLLGGLVAAQLHFDHPFPRIRDL